MNIDKHDLFRNVTPGYVFVVVMASFPIILGNRLFDVVGGKFELASLSIVGGFAVGHLLYSTYRIIFHILCREQCRLERKDADIIKQIIGKDTEIKNTILANIVIFGLMNSKNKDFENRQGYLMSSIHSFGASCWAILWALIFVVVGYGGYKGGFGQFLDWFRGNFRLQMISLFWVSIFFFLFIARMMTKRAYLKARKTFARIEHRKIHRAYNAYLGSSQLAIKNSSATKKGLVLEI